MVAHVRLGLCGSADRPSLLQIRYMLIFVHSLVNMQKPQIQLMVMGLFSQLRKIHEKGAHGRKWTAGDFCV